MLGIMRRNLSYYLVYGGFFLVIQTVMWQVSITRLSPALAMIGSFFLFFMVVVPAMSAEAVEERYSGYAFLSTLPLRLESVVWAKFALPLAALAAGVTYDLYMFESIGGLPPVVRDCRNILMLSAAAIIVLAGISFLLLYRFGAKNYLTFLVFAGVGLNLAGVVAFRVGRVNGVFEWLPRLVEGRSTSWFLAALGAGLIAYRLLMGAAVRIKRERMFA
jgi:hypothetical protein